MTKITSRLLLLVVILFMILMTIKACAQKQIYSSVASAQILDAVKNDTALSVKRDTIQVFGFEPLSIEIQTVYQYRTFSIALVTGVKGVQLLVFSGQMRVMLRPDDEYEILERLTK